MSGMALEFGDGVEVELHCSTTWCESKRVREQRECERFSRIKICTYLISCVNFIKNNTKYSGKLKFLIFHINFL